MTKLLEIFSPISLTRQIYVVLIICSAAVTAYFGKVMGGDFILVPEGILTPSLSMGFFTALGFAAVSVLAAVMAHHAGRMRSEGMREWKMVAQFALFLLACDIFTNYISWTTIRSQKIVISSNANTLAEDVRRRLERLRKTDSDLSDVIRAPGAWIAVKDAEKALQATLAARDREAKRVRCGRECEKLDAKARDLREEISKSRTREQAIAQRLKIRSEIAATEASARQTQQVIDPTNTQNGELASTLSMNAKPSEKMQFIASKIIGLVGAIMFSLGASACGLLLGVLTGFASYGSDRRQTLRPEIPDYRPQAQHDTAAGQQTLIMRSETVRNDQSLEALEIALQRLDQKYRIKAAGA